MRKQIMIPALLALSVGLVACSTKPNQNLEQARLNFQSLQGNPQSSTLAALETKDASDLLQKAEKAFRDKEDKDSVDQLAYLTNQRVELAKQTIALKSAEANLKTAAADRAKARLDARDAEIQKLQKTLSELNAKPTERGSVVTFGDVLFDLGKADLKPGAYGNIQQLAAFLKQNPERKVLIEGFTDSTGSDALNQGLSERRAASLQRALVNQGIDFSRISTRGYGKAFPVADNNTPASRAQNRRVEVTISNDANEVAPRR